MRMTKPTEKISFSVVGAGNRADVYLNELLTYYPDKFVVNGVFEPNPERRKYFQQKYQLKSEQIYDGIADFVKLERISDVVIIATLDDLHYIPAMYALKAGYDIILEKPISLTLDETVAIGKEALKYPNQMVAVCHVLRHTPFFSKIKEIIDSKELGEVVNIQHNENVGYFHYVHSYVRGNWRNTEIASPFIVAKSCHDMDIMLYLLGNKRAKKIASMGELTYFHHGNYDKTKMAPRCADCSIEPTCPFSALKIYGGELIKSVVFNKTTIETLKADLATSNYGRCVYDMDNDVADHQVSIIEFSDGIHATFNLSAFTEKNHRTIKIMCEKGEIRGISSTQEIQVTPFGQEPKVIVPKKIKSGHGGGDAGFMINFMESYLSGKEFASTLEKSIESHVMAFAAEDSRLNGGQVVGIQEFHDKVLKEALDKGLVK
ncbi:MAG: Gfo/Idh/MocA family oxidoreductase [Acholeplasmataceae bacterium]|jgi:predicted dehydrogenase|nr:Gfo/Idh/MocA family oxidoreductase [Acholeplasmataceae bacterium]